MADTKHVVFTNYLSSDDNFNMLDSLSEGGFKSYSLLVRVQKLLLKKFGHKQKGWSADVVDGEALTFLLLKYPTLKHVSWEQAIAEKEAAK